MNVPAHWRTTTAGILTIIGGLTNALLEYVNKQPVNLSVLGGAITAGVGLIAAADSANVPPKA
jgi:hypothetical protein